LIKFFFTASQQIIITHMNYYKLGSLILLLLFTILTIGCKKDNSATHVALDAEIDQLLNDVSDNEGRSFFMLPASDDYQSIPNDPKNPITEEKVVLGKLLFHETCIAVKPKLALSKNTYSCASCHFASAGFQAGRFQGIGEGGIGFGVNGEGRMPSGVYHGDSLDVQPIRSPTTLHVAYQEAMLWNGQFGATGINAETGDAWVYGTPIAVNFLGYEGTESQAIAAMDVHRLGMDEIAMDEFGYRAMFDAAFPDWSPDKKYSTEAAGLAIAAYERILLANEAPFQKWLRGDSKAMTEAQKEGAVLFFGKGECATCHTGPALNSMRFEALGMLDLVQSGYDAFQVSRTGPELMGRGGFTGKEEDMFRFKVPQLYNLKDSPFYGHGSNFSTVKEVIEYKNKAVKRNIRVPDEQMAPEFQPLGLTDKEIDLITEFIESGLYDAALKRYEPQQLPSNFCFPFNDPLAKQELGCN